MIEPYAPFEPTTACNPVEQPGVQAFRSFVLERHGGRDMGIVRACTADELADELARGESPSKHYEGRAWDWGPPSPAHAERLLNELAARSDELKRRAGIRSIIWDHSIWIAGVGWGPYHGDNPHTDHVHFDFSRQGAAAQTSFYTGGAPGPSGTGAPIFRDAPDSGGRSGGRTEESMKREKPSRPEPEHWRGGSVYGPFKVSESTPGIELDVVITSVDGVVREEALWATHTETGARRLITRSPGANRYCVHFAGNDYLIVTEA